MADMVEKIIKNIFSSLYQPFGFAILVAVLFMFVYMYAQEQGWKAILQSLAVRRRNSVLGWI